MRALTVGACLLALAGCKDYGRCLASHQTQYMYFIPIGKVMVPRWQTVVVCDRWEFPEGRDYPEE